MLPAFIEPQLPKLATEAPASDRWLHEVKFDGYRMLARIEGGRARLICFFRAFMAKAPARRTSPNRP